MLSYKVISKELFLSMVKGLFDEEIYPYDIFPNNITETMEKDLSKIDFTLENYTEYDSTYGYRQYPMGYEELVEDFHIFWMSGGGDWEYPVCFIFYWDGNEIRAYVPTEGNVWNKLTNAAYGNENDNVDSIDSNNNELDKECSKEKMISEILLNITLKN